MANVQEALPKEPPQDVEPIPVAPPLRSVHRLVVDQDVGAVDDGDSTAWAVPYTDLTMLLMVFFVVMLSQAGPRLTGSEEQNEELLSSQKTAAAADSIVHHDGHGLLSSSGAMIPIHSLENAAANGVLPDQNGVLQDGTTFFQSEYSGTKETPQAEAADTSEPLGLTQVPESSVIEMERRLAQAEQQRAQMARELVVTLGQLAQTQSPQYDQRSLPPESRQNDETSGGSPQDSFTEEWARRVQTLEARASMFLKENDLLSQIDLVATPLGVELRLPEELLFSSGSPELEVLGVDLMAKVLPLLMDTSSRIKVSGHTDNVPIKTSRFPSNWELSAARAIAVVRALRTMGVPDSRLEAVGYGANRPIVSNDTAEGRAKNRRVTIDLLPALN